MSYSLKFLAAFKKLMILEGGAKFHEVEGDSGGATKYGVSLTYLRSIGEDVDGDGDVDWQDINALDENDAKRIYKDGFWFDKFDELPERIAITTFCTGVNMGKKIGIKLLQRACNQLGASLLEDGIIGDKTVLESKKHVEDRLLWAYSSQMMNYYINIVKKKPSQVKFLRGWKNRAYDIIRK